jgi:hypothetical protein
MATNKEIKKAIGFERLLKYYVKLSSIRFIEQWVTLEVKNELILETFSSLVIPLNGVKDRLDFQCVLWKGMVK